MKIRKQATKATGGGSNGASARRRSKGEGGEKAEAKSRWGHLAKVASAFSDFRPAAEVLRKVQAMPTIFPAFDNATRVGGLPLERITLVHGPSAGGKALAEETPVLTPTGWRQIGVLSVGDSVIAEDGSATKVTGVYPQGAKQLYRVTFSDGADIECCAEHLWYTTTPRERTRGKFARGPRPDRRRIPTGVEGAGSVKSLAEILDDFVPREHAIPIANAVEYVPAGVLPLDPYLLGLMLGDGSISAETAQVTFCKPEEDVQEKLIDRLPYGDTGTRFRDGTGVGICGGGKGSKRESGTKSALRKLELLGKRSWEKFVPDLYMRASKEDRLELLRGLLDTDGTVIADRGAVEFTSTSFALADQVAELARSLGGYVTRAAPRMTGYSYMGEKRAGRESYRMRIVMPRGVVPVSSEKHLARWQPELAAKRRRLIVSIEKTRVANAVCISVAHPRRTFVAKDFIVTHNSFFCLGAMRSFLERDQPVFYVDAERTTPEDWVQQSLGEMLGNPLFKMLESTSYEETVVKVRKFLLAAKATKTNALVVVDSIRKLVPRDQLKNMMKGGVGADENVRNRSAQIKAQMNAAWLDELVVLLSESRSAMIIVAREIHDADAPPAFKKFGSKEPAVKTAGGAALFYDASLDLRISRIKSYGKKGDESFETYGDMHRIAITKSKVAGKDSNRYGEATFHISNGAHTPKGFDRARDLVEIARRFDVIEGTTALKWKDRKWRGEDKAVASLVEDAEAFAGIEAEVRALFARAGA